MLRMPEIVFYQTPFATIFPELPQERNINRKRISICIQGVSKKFGEWYQEKKKKEDTNK
jgi:hypothetical protein